MSQRQRLALKRKALEISHLEAWLTQGRGGFHLENIEPLAVMLEHGLRLTGQLARGQANALNIRVRPLELALPNLPLAFDGLRVLFLSDLHIDAHHTVEDTGITLGQAFAKAIGDKKGIRRYGHAYVPLDEALTRVVVDLSGRPGLHWNVPFSRAMIGQFDVDLAREFFQGFVNHAQVTLHVDNLKGDNAHHQCETVFKAFARALRMAVERDERAGGRLPSTKEML